MRSCQPFLRTGVSILLRNALSPKSFKSGIPYQCSKKSLDMEELMLNNSIHGAQIKDIHDVPFNVIIRPLPSELEEDKVLSLMETLKDPEKQKLVPPIDVLWVTGSEGGNYYYSFGGCHRYEAHKRLGLPTIRSKLVKSTTEDIRTYLGGSMPDLK